MLEHNLKAVASLTCKLSSSFTIPESLENVRGLLDDDKIKPLYVKKGQLYFARFNKNIDPPNGELPEEFDILNVDDTVTRGTVRDAASATRKLFYETRRKEIRSDIRADEHLVRSGIQEVEDLRKKMESLQNSRSIITHRISTNYRKMDRTNQVMRSKT